MNCDDECWSESQESLFESPLGFPRGSSLGSRFDTILESLVCAVSLSLARPWVILALAPLLASPPGPALVPAPAALAAPSLPLILIAPAPFERVPLELDVARLDVAPPGAAIGAPRGAPFGPLPPCGDVDIGKGPVVAAAAAVARWKPPPPLLPPPSSTLVSTNMPISMRAWSRLACIAKAERKAR